MKWGVKGTSRTSTAGSDGGMIELPREIKDALLNGYEVHIKAARDNSTKEMYAKITFQRVRVAGMGPLDSQKP